MGQFTQPVHQYGGRPNMVGDVTSRAIQEYPGHKVSSIEVVFDFLAAYSINLEKELTKILEDKKVVNVTIERSQKWIIFQNCEIVKRFTLQ